MFFETVSELLEIINNKVGDHDLFIVGAGNRGLVLGDFFDFQGIPYTGFVDKDDSLIISGKDIIPYTDVGQKKDAYFLLSSILYGKAMHDELNTQGIKDSQIIESENVHWFPEIFDMVFDVSKYTKKITIFKNKYMNQRCFLVGNGPSLLLSDLEKLKKEISFACNSIYAIYSKVSWHPFFYVSSDSLFMDVVKKDESLFIKLLSNCNFFFTAVNSGLFRKYKDCEESKLIFYRRRIEGNSFSSDCAKNIFSSGTIMTEMLQIAIYMGFSEIYLLGIDFTFSEERYKDGRIEYNNVQNHQIDIDLEEIKTVSPLILKRTGSMYFADKDKQLQGYQAVKQYADTHGIKIYNATRGGKLEVFPRVDFDSLFEK